jgi:hypothetical protein
MSEDDIDITVKKKRYQPSFDVLREYNSSGNERNFEEIISELKLVSRIQPNNKFNVSTKEIISDSYTDRVHRTYLRVESREATLAYIRKIIKEAIDLYYAFSSNKEPFYHQLASIIKREIISAKKGIENLARTYSNTDSLASDFEAVLTSVEVKLQLFPKKSRDD